MVVAFIVGVSIVAFVVAKIIFSTSGDIDNSDVAAAERLAPIGIVNIGEPFVLDNAMPAPSKPVQTSSTPEAAVAVEFSASAEDLALSVHAHPTLSEVVKEAALAVAGRVIHI